MASSFEFDLNDKTVDQIPVDPTELVQRAANLVEEALEKWTPGKVFHDKEQGTTTATYSTSKGSDFWLARHSKHKDISYDTFKKYILENHTEYEQKYIDLLHGYEKFEVPGRKEWYGALVHYKFPRMFSDRQMAVYILAFETTPGREFFIVSIPSDHPNDPQYTRATYCSIERVQLVDDEVVWTVITTSDSRGNIPRWIQNRNVTSMIAHDVPSFAKFVRSTVQ